MHVLSATPADLRHTNALKAALADIEAPDWVVAFGDTKQMMMLALEAHYEGKKIIHVGGGDTPHGTDSHPDHRTRDAISMLARVHCVANRDAVACLDYIGLRAHVFVTGSPGLDEVVAYAKTLDPNRKRSGVFEWFPEQQREGVWGESVWWSESQKIPRYPHRLPPDDFLRALAHCALFRSNSSAALYEAPIFNTPVELVGDRQAGRRGPYHHPEGRACEAIRKVIEDVCKDA